MGRIMITRPPTSCAEMAIVGPPSPGKTRHGSQYATSTPGVPPGGPLSGRGSGGGRPSSTTAMRGPPVAGRRAVAARRRGAGARPPGSVAATSRRGAACPNGRCFAIDESARGPLMRHCGCDPAPPISTPRCGRAHRPGPRICAWLLHGLRPGTSAGAMSRPRPTRRAPAGRRTNRGAVRGYVEPRPAAGHVRTPGRRQPTSKLGQPATEPSRPHPCAAGDLVPRAGIAHPVHTCQAPHGPRYVVSPAAMSGESCASVPRPATRNTRTAVEVIRSERTAGGANAIVPCCAGVPFFRAPPVRSPRSRRSSAARRATAGLFRGNRRNVSRSSADRTSPGRTPRPSSARVI